MSYMVCERERGREKRRIIGTSIAVRETDRVRAEQRGNPIMYNEGHRHSKLVQNF